MRVGEAALAHAERRPERVALVDVDGALAAGELAAAIRARAAAAEEAAPPGCVVVVDEERPADLLAAFLGAAVAGRAACVPPGPGAAAALAGARPPGAAPFYVGFTSGTSGAPRAFARSHASWRASFAAASAAFGIGDGDVVLAPGPLAHSLVLFAAVHALEVGSTAVLPGASAPRAAAAALAAGATHLVAVPVAIAELARRRPPAPALRAVVAGGGRLDPAVADAAAAAFPGAAVHEFYGASELSFVAVRRHGDGCPPGAVGRPFPGVEVRERDGVLDVRSALVFDGYVGDAADGPGRLLADGWATVGDRGHVGADGFVHVHGRVGEMLVVGGANVYPEPVEDVLARHPDVAEAALVGLPDPRWGDVPVAVLVPAGDAVDLASVRAHAERRLPRGQRPHRYVIVDALPRTASGKLARAHLRDVLASAP